MLTIVVDDDVVTCPVLSGAVNEMLNGNADSARASTDIGEIGIQPDYAQHTRA